MASLSIRENEWYGQMQDMKNGETIGTGHAAGLSYVPYNDYVTRLHEGERVLTAAENRAYSQGIGNVTVNVQGAVVREDSDIDRIADAVVDKLAEEIEQRRRLSWQ